MSYKKKIVESWIDVINRQAIDEIGNIFVEDGYVTYGAGGLPEAHGPAAIGGLLSKFYEGFSELETEIIELLDAENGKVVGRFFTRAKHSGSFMGIPATGSEIGINGIAIYTFCDGKISHEFNMDDLLGLLQQIGAMPS